MSAECVAVLSCTVIATRPPLPPLLIEVVEVVLLAVTVSAPVTVTTEFSPMVAATGPLSVAVDFDPVPAATATVPITTSA